LSKPRIRVAAGDRHGITARPASQASAPRSAYTGADLGNQALAGWMPGLQSSDAEWLRDRPVTIGRIRDMERNDGWVAAGIDRQVDMLVGGSLRLNAKPDAEALGISRPEAHALGRQFQASFMAWGSDPIFRCDAERQLNFTGLAALAAREFVGIGESLSVLRWRPRIGWNSRTAVHMVDPDRLSNPNGMPDSETLRGGVEKDEDGAPIAYHIRRGHPADVFGLTVDPFSWDRIERWDRVVPGWDRPKVLHVYDKRRPGQSRGISRFVAGILKSRMLSRYSENEVKAAAVNASIVGTIYTEMGAEYAAARLGDDSGTDWSGFNSQRADFYRDRKVLDDARFLTLFPSDKAEFNTQPRQTAGYPAFQTAFLQAFAASLGISYEQLSMDWSRTNYSSARAALNEVWRGIMRLRSVLIAQFAQPIYAAWLEDAIDLGVVELPDGAPDFYDAPAAYLRADWIGPGRGFIDPVKEAQASTLRRDGRISTLAREAAEQGEDWEDILDQQARENEEMQRLGIADPETDVGIVARSDMPDDRADS